MINININIVDTPTKTRARASACAYFCFECVPILRVHVCQIIDDDNDDIADT